MTSANVNRALIVCQPCGQRFESYSINIALFRFKAHACVETFALSVVLGERPEPDDGDIDADLAADYLERLRQVERLLDTGVHNHVQFAARIRAAIGVLPLPEPSNARGHAKAIVAE